MKLFRTGAIFWMATSVTLTCFSQTPVKVLDTCLTDHVRVYYIDGVQATSVTAIDTDEGLVVIDTDISPVFSRAIRKEILYDFGEKPFRYLINTHDHGDHTYGNQAFSDAIVIGLDKCREQMIADQGEAGSFAQQISAALTRMKARLDTLDQTSNAAVSLAKLIAFYQGVADGLGDSFVLTPPEITFSDSINLYLGNKTIKLMYIGGKAHSNSDILVFCPEENLLVTGDLIYENSLYFDSERIPCIDRWEKVLASLRSGKDTVKFMVTGHQGLLHPSLLDSALQTIHEKQKEFSGKQSALLAFKKVYENEGLNPGVKAMRRLKADSKKFYFLHPEFDTYVYGLMNDNKLEDARILFTELAILFPEAANAFDSLGEVYLKLDNKEKARENFKKSLELDPENSNAKQKLAGLEK